MLYCNGNVDVAMMLSVRAYPLLVVENGADDIHRSCLEPLAVVTLLKFRLVSLVFNYMESSHLRPSKIDDKVSATAEVTKVDGKKIEFKVSAYSGEALLGEGTHLRFIVDRERFISKLG